MKKRICSAIIALLMTASLAACSEAEPYSGDEKTTASTEEKTTEEETTEEETTEEKTTESDPDRVNISDYVDLGSAKPAVWKATDKKTGNSIYLMGTIHVLPTEADPIADYVNEIFESCDGVAVEYDVDALQSDMELMTEFATKMLYSDNSTIKDHISDETYQLAKAALQKDSTYTEVYDMFFPGFWINEFQNIALSHFDNLSTDGVDMTYIKLAKKANKEVVNIEDLDIQATAITGYTDALADYMLKDAAETYTEYADTAKSLGDLYNLWASGKSDELLEDEEEELEEIPEELKEDYIAYSNIMLYDRNKGMAEKASQYIKEGKNYFFMVGAMHFAGDKGVDDLLAEMGYEVERVH